MSEAQDKLIASIERNLDNGQISEAVLATDDRVLARITDGIYRQPASALRELIANAYDADSSNVYIQTDAPRFRTISVKDDGNGLTVASLASLIHHIGGSSKRTTEGVALGVVSKTDPSLSPNGRRLIGKIGIGLFSVSQLTRHFQIITKTAGTAHRLVAEVVLKTYTEDDLAKARPPGSRVQTGVVRIKAVKASDEASHGTEIILMDLRPQAREHLQSKDMWLRVDAAPHAPNDGAEPLLAPAYHIPRMGQDASIVLPEVLPWEKRDPPGVRFSKLFQAVVDEVSSSTANPKLETVLDNYLRTLWTLSLSAPLDYMERHPFDLAGADKISVYKLSNEKKGQASIVELDETTSIRKKLGFSAPERGNQAPFSVYVDDIQLKRPLRFRDLPPTGHVIKHPLMFVGRAAPDLSKIAQDERGGDLAFEGYLFWTPKVVPTEHNGVLVRIGDASGTLFDETFMKYQVAELMRLRQITAEIFVSRGLDAALNIDRESFNYSHPHYQYLVKWVHHALRQLTNAHKTLSTGKRAARDEVENKNRRRSLEKLVKDRVSAVGGEDPPTVAFVDDLEDLKKNRRAGVLAFERKVVFADVPKTQRHGKRQNAKRQHFTEQVTAVARILSAYGLLDGLPYQRQQKLLRDIVAVFAQHDGKKQ